MYVIARARALILENYFDFKKKTRRIESSTPPLDSPVTQAQNYGVHGSRLYTILRLRVSKSFSNSAYLWQQTKRWKAEDMNTYGSLETVRAHFNLGHLISKATSNFSTLAPCLPPLGTKRTLHNDHFHCLRPTLHQRQKRVAQRRESERANFPY